ncbi:hypothetical protein AUEXF2481DRAFT_131867 [Aureobasidium subglaciale EXF-2481]|uniref:Uncharacterized protein n=1 Tax=Aureobasidium subglaciale (strain EXF-2481) TaxID=1043005 RepID=A0A074ZPY3_AURSE|nr:uncharacterized protein AUEXF2481DRAFT_131867 [Aureobasidium subglaciale EXF-2481]KER00367.1 hypothetical protein AUEXF2481DRAFT_131867 [Aureobasidium subglaciale EXF-2481]
MTRRKFGGKATQKSKSESRRRDVDARQLRLQIRGEGATTNLCESSGYHGKCWYLLPSSKSKSAGRINGRLRKGWDGERTSRKGREIIGDEKGRCKVLRRGQHDSRCAGPQALPGDSFFSYWRVKTLIYNRPSRLPPIDTAYTLHALSSRPPRDTDYYCRESPNHDFALQVSQISVV